MIVFHWVSIYVKKHTEEKHLNHSVIFSYSIPLLEKILVQDEKVFSLTDNIHNLHLKRRDKRKYMSTATGYLSMCLAVISTVAYHIFQRHIGKSAHPLLSAIVTYLTAIVICMFLVRSFPFRYRLGEEIRNLNWASLGLALAIIGLEVGFLLCYRTGWQVGTTAVVSNSLAALVLLPVGAIFFSERISSTSFLGVFLCIAGLVTLRYGN